VVKYRIQWVSHITGNTGQGKNIFNSFEEANKVAMAANIEWPELRHWVAISFTPDYDDKYPRAFLV